MTKDIDIFMSHAHELLKKLLCVFFKLVVS